MTDDPSSSSKDVQQENSYVPVRRDQTQLSDVLPYARSHGSNHSGSGWEDAISAKSDDLDDTLELLATEIQNRRIPTATPMIMEDSPESIRSTSDTQMKRRMIGYPHRRIHG